MTKLNCVIVDDEEMATRVLVSHLEHVAEMEVSGIFHSAVNAFLELEKLRPDVLFLDIQMPKLSGISMLKMMPNPPLTILTTAHREYALDGFELDVVDYLLKPISLERFLKTVHKIRRLVDQPSPATELTTEPEHIFIKANRTFVKVNLEDILYVEAVKNHIKVVTKEQNHLTLMSISEFHDKLPTQWFLRVHRSFVINKNQVQEFNSLSVTIQGTLIPIGRSYKEEARDQLTALL